MRFPSYEFDPLSFWIGFIIASVLWWLLATVRPLLPRFREQIIQSINAFKQRNLAGAETYLLRETARRAQRMHLAAPLFPLDEILVTPRLLAPPIYGESEEKDFSSVPVSAQVLPYLPDWPELISPLGVPTISVAEALQNGSHIAIIGQPGSGKTVALAHLAQVLSRPAPQEAADDLSPAARYLPLYLHVLDLDVTVAENRDPLDNLRSAIIRLSSLVAQPQITRFLQTVFDNRMEGVWKPVLLLDGLDELTPDELVAAARYLRALLRSHPKIQAVVTASSDHVDGLTRAGFVPLGLASWTLAQKTEFVQRWGNLWVNQFLPEIRKQYSDPGIDPTLINNWLQFDLSTESPFELTLKVWAAYAGDLNGPSGTAMIETFINRHLVPTYRTAIDSLARKMVTRNSSSLAFDAMEEILSAISISEPLTQAAGAVDAIDIIPQEPEEKPRKRKGKSKLGNEAAIVSQGERIIAILMNAGILVRHSSGQMRFVNPIFLGYLAGPQLTPDEATALTAQIQWVGASLALRYLASCGQPATWLSPIFQGDMAPLHKNLLTIARWLPDIPPNVEWRSHLMRMLVNLIQTETLSFSARARFAAALVTSRDPSTAKLFRQQIGSPSPIIRRLSTIACGALNLSSIFNELLELLIDPDISVRNTACVVLGSLPGETSLQLMGEILNESDEDLRQIAAETLALRPKGGYEILETAAVSPDILARRAAVSGLLQVRENWVRQRLEKIAVEDGQWIVRNAATHAMDVYDKRTPLIPRPLPAPSESPWLLNFASRFGMGIAPDKPATEVLLSAVKSGSFDEQVRALEYLRNDSSEGIVRALYEALYSEQVELHEPATYALWWMSLSGAKLPDPAQFGLG